MIRVRSHRVGPHARWFWTAVCDRGDVHFSTWDWEDALHLAIDHTRWCSGIRWPR